MNDTEHLTSSESNKGRLLNSISEAEEYKVSRSDIDAVEPVIDSAPNMVGEAVIKMMDNMSVAELKMLKATCAVLINFKLNESVGKQ